MDTDGIVSLISSIRDRANELIAELLAKRGITGVAASHGSIFVNIFRHGSLTMGQLASLIGKKKNTVTVLVEKLRAAGYVNLKKSAEDGRVTFVELTEKGESFREDFQEISQILLQKVWGDMPVTDREYLTLKLRDLSRNLERK